MSEVTKHVEGSAPEQDTTTSDTRGRRSKANLFVLPKRISKQLRQAAKTHHGGGRDVVKYLWINMDEDCEGSIRSGAHRELAADEWLNVVDEAASLGVQCMVVGIGKTLQKCPEVQQMCQWAQDVHGITVGIHTTAETLCQADLDKLGALKPHLTWLFVDPGNMDEMKDLEGKGFRVCSSEVCREANDFECDGPMNLVFVGPQGALYPCGSVFGADELHLGHVAAKPLSDVLEAKMRLRGLRRGIKRNSKGCNGCPNKMVERMAAGSQDETP